MADTTESTELTIPQRKAIAALLGARSIREAAAASGTAERTLYRWLDDPQFARAVQAAEGAAVDAAARRLVALSDKAVTALEELLDSPTTPARLRLAAASEVLDKMLKLRELRDLEARLIALEAAINGPKHDSP